MNHRQPSSRLVTVVCVLAGTLAVPSVWAEDPPAKKGMKKSFQTAVVTTGLISSAGPLTKIYAGNDASSQVGHILEQTTVNPYEFFGPDITPADAGTFLAVFLTMQGILVARFLQGGWVA